MSLNKLVKPEAILDVIKSCEEIEVSQSERIVHIKYVSYELLLVFNNIHIIFPWKGMDSFGYPQIHPYHHYHSQYHYHSVYFQKYTYIVYSILIVTLIFSPLIIIYSILLIN